MEEQILNLLSKYVDLSEDEKASIIEDINYETFSEGTHILRPGQISRACYFNLKGLVRQYELDNNGEKTTYFYQEGEPLVAFESASQKIPSKLGWVCEEDTTLVVGNFATQEATYSKNPKLEVFSRMFIGQEFGKFQQLISTFIILTPEERYLKVLETRPDLLQRVQQYHLASFLGIKPETLSRIRKRISRST